jgi:hypothetical protein
MTDIATPFRLGTTNRRLDELAVAQGVEKECHHRPGLFVTVLPAGQFNPRFDRALRARVERLTKEAALKNGDAAAEEFSTRWRDPEFVAGALVAGMRGIYTAEGEEVAYTPELGVQVLADPGNADVLAWVTGEALDYERYYTGSVERDAKNSPAGSGGKRAGAGNSGKTRS